MAYFDKNDKDETVNEIVSNNDFILFELISKYMFIRLAEDL